MGARTQPKIYFSLRSPYSWLAVRELLEVYPDVAARLEWIPFWEPDELSSAMLVEQGGEFPYSDMTRAKNLYILQDVGRLARARGIELTWPVDRDPVWEIPHLAYLVARREGRGPQFIECAYRARWQEGRNICARETVAEIGTALSLDPHELAGASDDPALRAEGVRVLQRICDDGVFGVPFFVHGFTRFWGLDRLAQFAAHLRAQTPPATRMPEPVGAVVGLGTGSDEGHAGGCG